MTVLAFVLNSPDWSQCIDCSSFVYDCPYWDAATVAAAAEACQVIRCAPTDAQSSDGDKTVTVRGDILLFGKSKSRHPYFLQENCPSVRCDDTTMPCWGANVDCVAKPDNSWAQCIDCTPSAFQQDCVKWDTQLRSAAVQDCQVNCLNTMCTVDASGMQCVDDYTCVSQSDGAWSQCIGTISRGEA